MRPAFADTGGWFAVADVSDPRYKAATGYRDRLFAKRGRLITTDFVVDETLTLVRKRAGLQAATRWWWQITHSDRVVIETVGPPRFAQALDWFFGWPDHSFSFTDCTSFVVMRELGLRRALTTDQHFAEAGFEVVPG
jgi:predicted nucleic acid-binding protein